jgi:putative ABC transport system substrate-binding protein
MIYRFARYIWSPVIALAITGYFALCVQPELAHAEQPKRIGILVTTILPKEMEAFRKALSDAGYVEGRTIVLDWRRAKGDFSRTPTLARDLVSSKPDVIVVESTPAAKAAMAATTTIPIITVLPGDPVGSGLVQSLAHPGANVTGLSLMGPEVSIKQLELLKDVVPALKRVGVIWDPSVGWHRETVAALQAAAHGAALAVIDVPVQHVEELDGALAIIRQNHAEAVCFLDSAFYIEERQTVLRVASRSKLPVMYPEGHFVRDGGLISYSADSVDLFRRAARFVDQVLKGAKPGDLPVEQPTKFELLVNIKAAQALHLTIPEHVLARADEVIK